MVAGAAAFSKSVLLMRGNGGATRVAVSSVIEGAGVKPCERDINIVGRLVAGIDPDNRFQQVKLISRVYGKLRKALPPDPERVEDEDLDNVAGNIRSSWIKA